ncbi:hypothetical protein [Sphingomonas sp.]|uniref:hypothetical protein n=1 Tax=Sphingomonas sp. TaxID=28214 RepID=UPI0038A18593
MLLKVMDNDHEGLQNASCKNGAVAMRRVFNAFLVAALTCVASPLMAGNPDPSPPAPTATVKVPNDPNQVVCEYEPAIDSRLKGHKVCATRAEWASRRQEEREVIDKTQMQGAGVPGK